MLRRAEAQRTRQRQHRPVLAQHQADQPPDAALPGDLDQPLQQVPAQPLPLVGVADHQGELRLARLRVQVVARHAQHVRAAVVAAHGRQRHFAVVIEVAQPDQAVARQRLDQAEEAHADRVFRVAGVQIDDQRLVLRADGAHRHLACRRAGGTGRCTGSGTGGSPAAAVRSGGRSAGVSRTRASRATTRPGDASTGFISTS